jgi:hypothetical protein
VRRRGFNGVFPLLLLLLVPLASVSDSPARVSTDAGACAPRWHVVAETAGPWLSDVAALSPTDVWTVGRSGPSHATMPVAVHWDGRLLRRYTPFRPTRKGGGALWRLSATSPRDVWAYGGDGARDSLSLGKADRSVVVHWDGRRWTRLPTPPVPKDARVRDFAATGPNSAWLVGGGMPYKRPLVMHWDGERWGVLSLSWNVAPAGSDLRAITANAPDDVWAAGAQGLHAGSSYSYTDLVLHWDGRRWRQISSPLEREYGSGPFAVAIDTAPSGDAWTANQDLSANRPVFMRFPPSGRRPTVQFPNIDFSPQDVEAASATSGWVAGNRYHPSRSVLARWSGRTWRIEHIPHRDLKAEPTWSLSALSPTDAWAAGGRLLARYSC